MLASILSAVLGAGVAGSDLDPELITLALVTGVMVIPSRESLLRCILS